MNEIQRLRRAVVFLALSIALADVGLLILVLGR